MKGKFVKWAVLIIGIILLVRLVNNISRLISVGGRVTGEEQKLAYAQLLNKQLKNELQEAQTPQFMEREAREKLGYGKPGEVVLVIPDQYQASNPKLQATTDNTPNWIKWRKLYLGY
jgi:cell division protein FtsB